MGRDDIMDDYVLLLLMMNDDVHDCIKDEFASLLDSLLSLSHTHMYTNIQTFWLLHCFVSFNHSHSIPNHSKLFQIIPNQQFAERRYKNLLITSDTIQSNPNPIQSNPIQSNPIQSNPIQSNQSNQSNLNPINKYGSQRSMHSFVLDWHWHWD